MVKFIKHIARPSNVPGPPPEVHCWIECEGGEINLVAQVLPGGEDQILLTVRPGGEDRPGYVIAWALCDEAMRALFGKRLEYQDR